MKPTDLLRKLSKAELVEISSWINHNSDYSLDTKGSREDLINSLGLCVPEDLLLESLEEVHGIFFEDDTAGFNNDCDDDDREEDDDSWIDDDEDLDAEE